MTCLDRRQVDVNPRLKLLKRRADSKLPRFGIASINWAKPLLIEAMDACIELADKYGIGQISVDQAFHYLWGGGYVMEAAKKGYIAYTNCTAAITEVVPFMGSNPTLGTNPHSWGFPTTEALGYPIVIDWATSVIAMGRVQQLKREGKSLPSGAAVDGEGNETTDPTPSCCTKTFWSTQGVWFIFD